MQCNRSTATVWDKQKKRGQNRARAGARICQEGYPLLRSRDLLGFIFLTMHAQSPGERDYEIEKWNFPISTPARCKRNKPEITIPWHSLSCVISSRHAGWWDQWVEHTTQLVSQARAPLGFWHSHSCLTTATPWVIHMGYFSCYSPAEKITWKKSCSIINFCPCIEILDELKLLWLWRGERENNWRLN